MGQLAIQQGYDYSSEEMENCSSEEESFEEEYNHISQEEDNFSLIAYEDDYSPEKEDKYSSEEEASEVTGQVEKKSIPMGEVNVIRHW